jgi:acyl-CoA thioester hydrolase
MAYVAWFELGRTEMMRVNGLSYAEMERRGVLLPVVRLEIDYLGAAGYEELVSVHTSLAEVKSRRVRFEYTVLAEDGRRIAEGSTVLVCVGPDGRPRRLPEELREGLAALVEGAGTPTAERA